MPPARALLVAATVAVLALTAWSLARGPLPLGVTAGALGAYLALGTAGTLWLRLRMFADAVIEGAPGSRGVALTFDDGPHPVHTRAVLDALDAAGARATFFVIGAKAEAHPDVVREIVARGHAIGLHSFAHDRLFSLRGARAVREDLERGVAALEAILGERTRLFRPPIGHTSFAIARVVDELDLVLVGWSVAARDGLARTRPEDVLARVLPRARDGAIILLHDAPERGDRAPAGVVALPTLLERLRAERLDVVPLESMLPEDA